MQDVTNVFDYLHTDNDEYNQENIALGRDNTLYDGGDTEQFLLATSGYSIGRDRLLKDLIEAGSSSGLTFICAPYGFGKTQLILSYAQYVRSAKGRGIVRMLDAEHLSIQELTEQLCSFEHELMVEDKPLIVIDNIAYAEEDSLQDMVSVLRRLRNSGFELVCAVSSSHHPLVRMMTDSFKLGANALKLKVKEMSEWMKAFAISPQLDLYDMSQGVPVLVRALQGQTESENESNAYSRELKNIYTHVLDDAQRYGVQDCMIAMLLIGHGSFSACNEFGIKFTQEQITLIAHDYPLFGIDVSKTKFQCPPFCKNIHQELLLRCVSKKSYLVASSARILLEDNRVDEAIALLNEFADRKTMAEIISQYPMCIPLMGHAQFVIGVIADESSSSIGLAGVRVGLILSAWTAALLTGDLKATAALATQLLRRADVIEQEISYKDWLCAEAFQEVFVHRAAFELPHVRYLEYKKRTSHLQSGSSATPLLEKANTALNQEGLVSSVGGMSQPVEVEPSRNEELLRLHSRALQAFIEGDCEHVLRELESFDIEIANTVDIPAYLTQLDIFLMRSVSHEAHMDEKVTTECMRMKQALLDANLKELSSAVDAVHHACLMFVYGMGDESHNINSLQTIAVRRSDLTLQLLCRIAAGWNELILSQASNAHFRAQQTEKICPENLNLLSRWIYLLEVCALTRMSSRAALQERIKQIDPETSDVDFFESWAVAIMLLDLRCDSEFSAWYSVHKDTMLDQQFRCVARLALSCVNVPAVTLKRMLPARVFEELFPKKKLDEHTLSVVDEVVDSSSYNIGQISIKLFGGFSVSKNGHLLTEKSWRRRKAALLCARLALVNGSFVNRRAIIEEFWPDKDYQKGRENLYVTLSQMRKSLGQTEDGPQYVVVQGEGIALNRDYVDTDIIEFDRLVREILRADNKSNPEDVLDNCFNLEKLYMGPLFIPESGSIDFFIRRSELYDNKFVDAMLIGSRTARNNGCMSVATWFITAALKQQRYREDVVREAMLVMDKQGRRREIVQLYASHHRYFSEELDMLPEKETRELYEKLLNNYKEKTFI